MPLRSVVGLFLNRYVDPRYYPVVIVSYCLFYLLVCALGFSFTYRNWKRDKAPLLEEIRRRQETLQEEGGTAWRQVVLDKPVGWAVPTNPDECGGQMVGTAHPTMG